MFTSAAARKIDPDPEPEPGDLQLTFADAKKKACFKKLATAAEGDLFYQMHTATRLALPEADKQFMKELNPALVSYAIAKGMPVIGVYVGEEMVSGCIIFYPSDPLVTQYLPGYDFDGQKKRCAVVSAVWTKKGYEKNGLSRNAIYWGADLAVFDNKDIFIAKVDKKNLGSLGLFKKMHFDINVQGADPLKNYPRLVL
jgi:hypothetical protein